MASTLGITYNAAAKRWRRLSLHMKELVFKGGHDLKNATGEKATVEKDHNESDEELSELTELEELEDSCEETEENGDDEDEGGNNEEYVQ
ncbi:hypothetical protein N7495_003456 [Penicillium taxi]|uniref:uncharacterized protein n=1 Tax=Penicillium taxi TaxID=168475 RepID=UPI00254529D5|nr:uncharacterized protein N7495_003456 [Penicillium taxi]KAJ5902928.1 hypothetical protein N7495_003456 [Penicillium taxi]